MNRFSIKDIENLTGIKAHTLRIWEQRHGIIMPKRTDTNIRYYDANDLKQALRVALLNQQGYKISRIQQMSDKEMEAILQNTIDVDLQFEYLLNNLLEATIDMDVDKFESLINKHIKKYGIEDAIERLLFGFLEKIGIMWMTNRILPAQEHIISNILYRKLLLGIERLPPVNSKDNRTEFLLFLPEGEIHELGLLYVHYMLLKNNKKTVYLGANTPLDQVEFVCDTLQPQYLYTHITSASNDFDINSYFDKLTKAFNGNNIFVSGSMLQKAEYSPELGRVTFLTSLQETKDSLAHLN